MIKKIINKIKELYDPILIIELSLVVIPILSIIALLKYIFI